MPVAIVVQDTTELDYTKQLDYTKHPTLDGIWGEHVPIVSLSLRASLLYAGVIELQPLIDGFLPGAVGDEQAG